MVVPLITDVKVLFKFQVYVRVFTKSSGLIQRPSYQTVNTYGVVTLPYFSLAEIDAN